jgi:hypothetical protein
VAPVSASLRSARASRHAPCDAAGDGLLDGRPKVGLETAGLGERALHIDPEARREFVRRHTEEARQVRDD